MSVTSAPPSAAGPGRPALPAFQQRLGAFDATMLVAGTMIGSGIFIVSADIARDVGSSGWLLAVWVVTGLITIMGALSYAELAAMMPHAGGQYVYLREAYSPLWGFLYGWTLFLVIQTGTIAAVGVAFAKFLGVLVPSLGTGPEAELWRYTFAEPFVISLPLPWRAEALTILERQAFTISAGQLVAVALTVVLTAINCRGVHEVKRVQNVFTVAKTVALLLLIYLGMTVAANLEAFDANMKMPPEGAYRTERFEAVRSLTGASAALVALMVAGGTFAGSLFTADAWNNITFIAGEIRNPRRNLPLSLIVGAGLVAALYVLANVAYLVALPVRGKPGLARFAAAVMKRDRAEVAVAAAEARAFELAAELAEADADVQRERGSRQLEARRREEAAYARSKAAEWRKIAVQREEKVEREAASHAMQLGIAHAQDDRVATAVMQLVSPRYGPPLMAIAIMISTFGCVNGVILMGARLYYAMAHDGLFFRTAGTLNGRHVPAAGLILQAAWSVLLIFSGTYSDLLDFIMFAALLFYVLTVTGLFVLRRTRPDAERPYKVLGYPAVPALYVLLCALIMLDLLVVRPEFTWPGLIIVLTGIPVYFFWRWKYPPRAA